MQSWKIFDIQDAPKELFNISHKLNGECHGNGNDSFYMFEITKTPSADDESLGYLTDEETKKLNDWLIKDGGMVGENVLVKHWW